MDLPSPTAQQNEQQQQQQQPQKTQQQQHQQNQQQRPNRPLTAKYSRPAEMPNTFFEKHLILSRSDGQPLKIPPTRRELCLRSVLGTGAKVDVKSITNGLLVSVQSYAHSQVLQKLTKITTGTSEVPVKCVPQNSLNYTKGVLHDRFGQLADELPEHLNEALALEGVVDINRITVMSSNGGPRIPGKTYFLTFLRDKIPTKVKIGFEIFKIQEYTPRPQFCNKCLRYGHVAKYCRSQGKCSKCCSTEHLSDTCPSETVKCYDCTLAHRTGSKECSAYQREQEVLKIMNRDHLLPREARAKIENLEDHGMPISSVVKTGTTAELNALKFTRGVQAREIEGLKFTVKRLTDERVKLLAGGSAVNELTQRISAMEEQCKQVPLLQKELDNQRELFKQTEIHHQKVQKELEDKLVKDHKELEATKLRVSAAKSTLPESSVQEELKQLNKQNSLQEVELLMSQNEIGRLKKQLARQQQKPPAEEEEPSLDDSQSSMPPSGALKSALSGLAKATKRTNDDMSSSPPGDDDRARLPAKDSPAKKFNKTKSPRNSYDNSMHPPRGHSSTGRGQRGSGRGRGHARRGSDGGPSSSEPALLSDNRYAALSRSNDALYSVDI